MATAAAAPALESARRQREVPRIARGLEHRIVTGAAVAELRDVGLAEDDRAGGAQPLDGDVVFIGDEIFVGGGTEDRADSGGQDEILDTDRHAGEQTRRASGYELALDAPRFGARQFRRWRAEGVERRLERRHSRQRRLDDFDRREFAAAKLRGQRHGVHPADFVRYRHGSSSRRAARLNFPRVLP